MSASDRDRLRDTPEQNEAQSADGTAEANRVVPVPAAMTPEELDVRADAVESVRDADARDRAATDDRPTEYGEPS
jgi:hypothetical protein